MFLLCTLDYIASFNFFWLEQSSNTLKFKSCAFKGFYSCFQLLSNLQKNAREFKVLAILYFYRVIIIFKLTCNKCFLLLYWTKLEIFVHICLVSLFHLHLKIYNKNSLWTKSNRPSSSALSILYFFLGNFTNWKHSITIFYYIVKKQ